MWGAHTEATISHIPRGKDHTQDRMSLIPRVRAQTESTISMIPRARDRCFRNDGGAFRERRCALSKAVPLRPTGYFIKVNSGCFMDDGVV